MGAIVGAILGAVALLFLLVGTFFLVRRHHRLSAPQRSSVQQADYTMREAILADASPVDHAPGVTPFMEEDSSRHPSSSIAENSGSAESWPSQEVDSKTAYRLRRIPPEELQRRAAMPYGPPASTTYPSTSPSAVSNDSDPAFSRGLLLEINNLWREISAIRTNEGTMSPPEYDA